MAGPVIDAAEVPAAKVSWRPSYRLIPSRYPTVGVYDAIADPADLEVVFAIEALANPRVRDEGCERVERHAAREHGVLAEPGGGRDGQRPVPLPRAAAQDHAMTHSTPTDAITTNDVRHPALTAIKPTIGPASAAPNDWPELATPMAVA